MNVVVYYRLVKKSPGLFGWGPVGTHSIPYPVNRPQTRAQFSPHIHTIFDLGPNWACWLGPNWDPLTTQQSAQKPKFSLAHVLIPYPKWGPTGLASWGPIGAHSIPSKQRRNPSPVYPTNPHNIRRGSQQGLLAEAQLGPTPYPANSPETQAQFSPHIHAISDVGPNWAC